jgi:hypothetical protein
LANLIRFAWYSSKVTLFSGFWSLCPNWIPPKVSSLGLGTKKPGKTNTDRHVAFVLVCVVFEMGGDVRPVAKRDIRHGGGTALAYVDNPCGPTQGGKETVAPSAITSRGGVLSQDESRRLAVMGLA